MQLIATDKGYFKKLNIMKTPIKFIISILFILNSGLQAHASTQNELNMASPKEQFFHLNNGSSNVCLLSLAQKKSKINSGIEISMYKKFTDESLKYIKGNIELITIILGISGIFLQNYLQHRSNYKLKKENEREKLKLSIYKNIIQAADVFYKCKAYSYLILIRSYLDYAAKNNITSEPSTEEWVQYFENKITQQMN